MSETREYAYEPGMVQLEPGDLVQLDGGPHIVTRANGSGATCEPVGKKHIEGETRFGKKFSMDVKLKGASHISRMVPKWLVIERRGEQGLANHTAAKKGMEGMITLELGDCICHGGEWRTVIKVYEGSCILGSLGGEEFTEKRMVNEFFTKECGSSKRVRFDKAQRAAHLAEFLQQRKSPQPETNEASDETTVNESEKPMAKKVTETKKSKTVKVNVEKIAKSKSDSENNAPSPAKILRALGKAGITVKHGQAIAVAQKWDVKPYAVSNYVRDGRGNVGAIAELTTVEIESFKSSATDPTETKE